MIEEKEILEFARSLGEGVGEEIFVEKDGKNEKKAKVLKRGGLIFLIVWENTDPLRIELKCDGKLGKLLREKYETVMLSKTLGGSGIEIICSGQVMKDEIYDLVRHSFIVSEKF